MKLIKTLVAATAIATVCGAQAITPTDVYVFGDSLSDSGYAKNLAFYGNAFGTGQPSKEATSTSPEYIGHTGDEFHEPGKMWPQQLAPMLGLIGRLDITNNIVPDIDGYPDNVTGGSVSPNKHYGTNFAAGGATTSGEGIGLDVDQPMHLSYHPPSLRQQVESYLWQLDQSGQAQIDPNAVFILWGGANNLLKIAMEDLCSSAHDALPDGAKECSIDNDQEFIHRGEEAIATSLGDIRDIVNQLKGRGAKNFIILTLPWINLTPMAEQLENDPKLANMNIKSDFYRATSAYRNLLSRYLGVALQGTNHKIIHIEDYLQNIVDDHQITIGSTSFSFLNVTDTACKAVHNETQPLEDGLSTQALTCNPRHDYDGTALADADLPRGYVFEDSVHPTSRMHTVIATKLKEIIDSM